ncbi:unnamed protein product [Absidia cylindrospora]
MDSWELTSEQEIAYWQTLVNQNKETYFDLYFHEKQKHLERIALLDDQLVPTIIKLAHSVVGPKEDRQTYRQQLQQFVRQQFSSQLSNIRKLIWLHVQIQDPWLIDGGPSIGGPGDVEINDIFDIQALINWGQRDD